MHMSSPASPSDTRLSAPIDLLLVRRLFAHPQRVAESLFLRREIAARMHERLALVNLAPRHVLNAGFAEVDLAPHVLPFVDMHDLGDMLVNAGFSTPVMDMETITVTYASPEKLLAEVRALGGNPLQTRRRGLLGRSGRDRLIERL